MNILEKTLSEVIEHKKINVLESKEDMLKRKFNNVINDINYANLSAKQYRDIIHHELEQFIMTYNIKSI